MYRLSRTIDATVSKEIGALLVVLAFIIVVIAISIIISTTGVVGSKGKNSRWLLLAGVIDGFALLVAGQRSAGGLIIPVVTKVQTQLCTGDGLSCGGIYYDIALFLVGLCLLQQTDARYKIQLMDCLRLRIRAKAEQIDTSRQSC